MSNQQFIKGTCSSYSECDSRGVSIPEDCKEYCGQYGALIAEELERLTLQQQSKITELQLELEKEKEATRNALADRAQTVRQLSKVREANEQLAAEVKQLEKKAESYGEQLKDQIFKKTEALAQTFKLASAIHYPLCWDTAAYPTLHDALHEIGCSMPADQCAYCKEQEG